MFRDIDDARAVIRTIAVDEADTPLSDGQQKLLLDRLIAQFWITPSDEPARPGATRFGGAPDVPAAASWPMRPVPSELAKPEPDLDGYFKIDMKHFEWIANHVVRKLPFEFLAQIDLQEAAKYPSAAHGLPDKGRLLFFWDGVVGTLKSGPEACHVLWDNAETSSLIRLGVPQLLHELEAAYDPDGRHKKPYVWPERPMRLMPMVHLPHRSSADLVADAALAAIADDKRFEESYALLTAMDEGQFSADGRNARRQRFMGSPDPEQDDPRFDAIVAGGFAPPPWKGAQLSDAARAALDWQLLLQADLGDLSQDRLTEGTVYFLIRRDDLTRRDFSRVHAIYQQT